MEIYKNWLANLGLPDDIRGLSDADKTLLESIGIDWRNLADSTQLAQEILARSIQSKAAARAIAERQKQAAVVDWKMQAFGYARKQDEWGKYSKSLIDKLNKNKLNGDKNA